MIYVKKAWRLGQKQLQSEILQNAQRNNPDQKIEENVKEAKKVEELPAFTNDPLKECVDTVQQATAESDFGKAVDSIRTYYTVYFCNATDLDDVYIELLEAVEAKLKQSIAKKLEEAVTADNLAQIEVLAGYHSGLGKKQEALSIYKASYLSKLIKIEGETIMELLNAYLQSLKEGHKESNEEDEENEEDYNLLDFVTAIRRLFEFIALFIEEKSTYIDKYFGGEALTSIIEDLLQQTDIYSANILDLFISHFEIQKLLVEINMSKAMDIPSTSHLDSDQFPILSSLDARQFTDLLDQMSFISQCSELLDNFIITKASRSLINPRLKRYQFVREVTMYYNILEEYFMIQSCKKAIEIDSKDTHTKTSTMIDNVFFIFKRCSLRSISSNNVNSSCSIINMIANLLNIDIKHVLESQLVDLFTTSHASGTFDLLAAILLLNNVDMSLIYLQKLHSELDQETKKLCNNSSKDLEKVSTCLHELHAISKSWKEDLLMKYLSKVCTKLYARIAILLVYAGIEQASYELDELKFLSNEINDPFMSKFVADLQDLFSQYKDNFTENNYTAFIEIILQFTTTEIERNILKKTYTLLGAVQLERELNVLIQFFSDQSSKPVRSKFARISQISSLLNLEKLNDAQDIWNSLDIKWKITPDEAKMTLKRRIDFSPDIVDKLLLVPRANKT